VWESVWTVLEVKLAVFLPPLRINLLVLEKKKVSTVDYNKVTNTIIVSEICSELKATNLHNEKKKKEQDFPQKAVWDSAMGHMGDFHLEPLLGLRHSMLLDFGTDSVLANHYLVSCYQ
jgi:hypothetical protein